MAEKNMTPIVCGHEMEVLLLVTRAMELLSGKHFAGALTTLVKANRLLFPKFAEMLRLCRFAETTIGIRTLSPNDWQVNMLSLINPQPFAAKLMHPGVTLPNTLDAQNYINSDPGVEEATTAQFLSYLIQNQAAGIEFPIAHLQSVGFSDGGNPACLYVTITDDRKGRQLRLGNLKKYSRPAKWRYFTLDIS